MSQVKLIFSTKRVSMSLNIRSKLMMAVAIIFAVYSLFWSLAPYTSINLPARFILDLADWPVDNLSTPLDRNTMWLSSISAGLLGAISIFLGGIVAPALKDGNKPVIKTTIYAMVFWFIIDSAGSIAAGVSANVFFNSIYLILVLIPLVGTTRYKR